RAAWRINQAAARQFGIDSTQTGIVPAGGRAVEGSSRRRGNGGAPPFLNPVRLRRRALPDWQLRVYHLLVRRVEPGDIPVVPPGGRRQFQVRQGVTTGAVG